MCDARRSGVEQAFVRFERICRMREVDEARDSPPLERLNSVCGGIVVARSRVGAGEESVGNSVAVSNPDVHRCEAAYASTVDADPVELRVLGCLLEKQRTTPEQYPLSLNALRLACNQTTNRDPIVTFDEQEIHAALQRLARRGWTRLASGAGSRAAKYRQLLDEALGLAEAELAVLCVLLLRGPQTPGELNQRTGRLHPFGGLDEIHHTLEGLVARELVERLERRPGQKEERFRHRLGGDDESLGAGTTGVASSSVSAVERPSGGPPGTLEERVATLEREMVLLRDALDTLSGRFAEDRS